jgi:hypothetical protein
MLGFRQSAKRRNPPRDSLTVLVERSSELFPQEWLFVADDHLSKQHQDDASDGDTENQFEGDFLTDHAYYDADVPRISRIGYGPVSTSAPVSVADELPPRRSSSTDRNHTPSPPMRTPTPTNWTIPISDITDVATDDNPAGTSTASGKRPVSSSTRLSDIVLLYMLEYVNDGDEYGPLSRRPTVRTQDGLSQVRS